MSKLTRLFALLAIICFAPGCALEDPPEKDPDKAAKMLVGKWEGEWAHRAGGCEFKAEGGYSEIERTFDDNGRGGAPERRAGGTFRLSRTGNSGGSDGHPNALELIVEFKRPDGFTQETASVEVRKDKITFLKAEGPVGSYRRVKAYSARLAGKP